MRERRRRVWIGLVLAALVILAGTVYHQFSGLPAIVAPSVSTHLEEAPEELTEDILAAGLSDDGGQFSDEGIGLVASVPFGNSESITVPERQRSESSVSSDELLNTDGQAVEPVQPRDGNSYWVVSGVVVFGLVYDESIHLHADLSEEDWQQQLGEWSRAGMEMVSLEPIALRQPDQAIMEIMRTSAEGESWKVHSLYLNRRDFSIGENPEVPGTDGVRLWVRMVKGNPVCGVGMDEWWA